MRVIGPASVANVLQESTIAPRMRPSVPPCRAYRVWQVAATLLNPTRKCREDGILEHEVSDDLNLGHAFKWPPAHVQFLWQEVRGQKRINDNQLA